MEKKWNILVMLIRPKAFVNRGFYRKRILFTNLTKVSAFAHKYFSVPWINYSQLSKWAVIRSRLNNNSPILKTLSEEEPVTKSISACFSEVGWRPLFDIQNSQVQLTKIIQKPISSFTKQISNRKKQFGVAKLNGSKLI